VEADLTDLTRRALRFCLVAWLIARVVVSLVGLAVGSLTANPLPRDPGTSAPVTAGLHNIWDGTDRLDGAWFETIADKGYDFDRNAAAFFPLYPMLVRGVSAIPGVGTFAAATLISNLALLLALVVLYRLTSRELSEADARRTILLLLAFPTSFFLFAPYSESLFLLLAVVGLAAARSSRWVTSAAAGVGAAATRSIGVILAPSLAWEAWARPPGRERTRALLAAGAVLIGPLLYFGWWQLHAGDPLRPLEVQTHWKRTIQFPPVTLARGLYQAIHVIGAPDGGYWISDAVLTCLAIGGVIAIWRRVAPSLVVFGVLALAVPLCFPYPGRDLTSMSRFALVAFPAFWGMARWTRRPAVLAMWLAVSIPAALWHALLFMHYRHIY
jgi:hypothetical protein